MFCFELDVYYDVANNYLGHVRRYPLATHMRIASKVERGYDKVSDMTIARQGWWMRLHR
jgi:hypothetical protein